MAKDAANILVVLSSLVFISPSNETPAFFSFADFRLFTESTTVFSSGCANLAGAAPCRSCLAAATIPAAASYPLG